MRGRVALGLACAYGATVAALTAARAAGLDVAGPLASSPARLADGDAWTLATSGLVLTRELAGIQLVLAGLTCAAALRVVGARRWWWVTAAGHVGSALVAYAGVAVLHLLAPGSVADELRDADYGISCVWAASAGALLARRVPRRPRWAVVAGSALLLTWLTRADLLVGVEHGVALALGAAAARRPLTATSRRRATLGAWSPRPSAPSARSRPSSPPGSPPRSARSTSSPR